MYKFVLANGVDDGSDDVASSPDREQQEIVADNENRQKQRAASAVVHDIQKISTFFADVIWPLLLKYVARFLVNGRRCLARVLATPLIVLLFCHKSCPKGHNHYGEKIYQQPVCGYFVR